MSENEVTMSAQNAIELVLSNRASSEPGFLERVALDPAGVVAEIAAEVADGRDLDLSGVSINVHVQTPNSVHFVCDVNPAAELAEVSGFNFKAMRFGFDVRPPVLQGKTGGTVGNNTTTDTACHTNVCKSKAAGSCPAQEVWAG